MKSRRTFFGWLGAFVSAPFAPRVNATVGHVHLDPHEFEIERTPYRPSVGDTVLYVLNEGKNKGQIRPATIIRVCDDGSLNLSVIPDGDADSEPEPKPEIKPEPKVEKYEKLVFDNEFFRVATNDSPMASMTVDWNPPPYYLTFPGLPFYRPNVKRDENGAPGAWRRK